MQAESAPNTPGSIAISLEGTKEQLTQLSDLILKRFWQQEQYGLALEERSANIHILEITSTNLPLGDEVFEFIRQQMRHPDFDQMGQAQKVFLAEQNWVLNVQRALNAVKAGRFTLYGAHDKQRFSQQPFGLQIDASTAFGTGHHGTTQGCLEMFDILYRSYSPRKIADVGCGAGTLGLCAARLLKQPVIMSDIDPEAVKVSIENARINHLSPWIKAVQATGFNHPVYLTAGPFDLVFANILAGPLCELASSMKQHVKKNGCVILSGLLNHQAQMVRSAYRQQGFVLKKHIKQNEWSTLLLQLQF